MFDFAVLKPFNKPYRHFVGKAVNDDLVAKINSVWPDKSDDRWVHENGKFSKKSAMLFPRRLSEPAQKLAEYMYSDESCKILSEMVGIELQPDPWFLKGPLSPMLGGGLHEIHPGGLLRRHVDFDRHPSGLTRCLNLLIYLNQNWKEKWNGNIELGLKNIQSIVPFGGNVVMFETVPDSWHGHPNPLACPDGITRRSLALYYYKTGADLNRLTTVYIKK